MPRACCRHFDPRAKRSRSARSRRAAACRKAWRSGSSTHSSDAGGREVGAISIAVRCGRSSRSCTVWATRHRAPTTSFERSLAQPERAAAAEGVELISLDNRYNRRSHSANADISFVKKSIRHRIPDRRARRPIVSAKYRDANIPLIAIEVPHRARPTSGANNYEAGLIAAAISDAGPSSTGTRTSTRSCDHARARRQPPEDAALTGMLVGMKETFPQLEHCR